MGGEETLLELPHEYAHWVIPLVQVVQSVADSMLMNEMELCVWSIYLDKLEPNWIQTSEHAALQLVHFVVVHCRGPSFTSLLLAVM
jgi:hypothetical protein